MYMYIIRIQIRIYININLRILFKLVSRTVHIYPVQHVESYCDRFLRAKCVQVRRLYAAGNGLTFLISLLVFPTRIHAYCQYPAVWGQQQFRCPFGCDADADDDY